MSSVRAQMCVRRIYFCAYSRKVFGVCVFGCHSVYKLWLQCCTGSNINPQHTRALQDCYIALRRGTHTRCSHMHIFHHAYTHSVDALLHRHMHRFATHTHTHTHTQCRRPFTSAHTPISPTHTQSVAKTHDEFITHTVSILAYQHTLTMYTQCVCVTISPHTHTPMPV